MITITVPLRQSIHFRANSTATPTSFPRVEKSPKADNPSFYSPKSNLNMSKTSSHMYNKSASGLASLMELKHKRKLLENNSRMLSSRLSALTQEERRLKSHTEGVKKKAQDLLVHRLERQEKKREKEANVSFRGFGEKTVTELRQTVVDVRTQHISEMSKLRETLYESKRKEAQKRKEEKLENLEKIQEAKEEKISGLKTIYLKVKEEEVEVQGQVKKAWQNRLVPVRDNKEKKMRQELAKMELKEYELKRLGRQEDHMLEMLQKAEETESKSRNQYNEVRQSTVEDLMQKYKYFLPKGKSDKFNKTFSSPNKLTMKSF